MPLTADVGKNIRELKSAGKKRPWRQIQAIALEGARRKGANIPEPKQRLVNAMVKSKKKY